MPKIAPPERTPRLIERLEKLDTKLRYYRALHVRALEVQDAVLAVRVAERIENVCQVRRSVLDEGLNLIRNAK